METPEEQSLDRQATASNSAVVKALAPEDIQPGDFVTLLHVIREVPSYFWCADASLLPVDEPVRIQLVPYGSGRPLKVESICLPFVLVKRPSGKRRTLDVRTCRLARLDEQFGAVSWKAHKKAFKKKVRAQKNED